LKLTSHATSSSSDPVLPPTPATETYLKRDEWMLETPPAPVVRVNTSLMADESLTDDYGDPASGSRTINGGVDFFSSLGTEVKKKERPDHPDPAKV
jgi:hypothetical protein